MTSYGGMHKIRSLSCYHAELESATATQGDPYFVADYSNSIRYVDKTRSVQCVCLHWKWRYYPSFLRWWQRDGMEEEWIVVQLLVGDAAHSYSTPNQKERAVAARSSLKA